MSLEQALEFIRETDRDTWNLLIKEMNRTSKVRAQKAAASFNVGELVSCDLPDQKEPMQGRIIKIDRGRVTLAVPSQQTGFMERISVPGTMVRRCV